MAITNTLAEHWKYVSEGGATVVFSYIGPPNPHFSGMVLRLSKSSGILHDQYDFIEFQQKCIGRLIPSQYLPCLKVVVFDRIWIERFVSLHDVDRPQHRRNEDQIDLTRKTGVLATDLVGGDWLAVEIKVIRL